MSTFDDTAKTIFDFGAAALLLMASAPLQAAAASAVCISMGRPIFFRQRRPGKDGVLFRLWKFRTMREPCDGEDRLATDGMRLTLVGKVLRATSLDELPTLWHVLRGEMSLVGPRPLLERYLERYSVSQWRRHEVKPGITGWAQINGRNAISWEEKFKLDVWYVDNWSMVLDLKILALTALHVLRREGISASEAATMPEFMGTLEAEGSS